MDIIISILQLLLGLGLLIVSADFLLKKIIDIAGKTGISPALIAVTVVALGTSLPELITSIMAALKGIPDISLGNVVGSNLFNILAVIGCSCVIRPLQNNLTSMKKEWVFLLLATCLLWILGQDLFLTRLDGFLFLFAFALFLYFIIKGRKDDRQKGDMSSRFGAVNLKDGFVLCLSMALMLGGAHLALLGAIHLGKTFGMSQRIIGLTIVSIGTGLPELAASMVAVYRKQYGVSIANVIGSNVMNTLLITGSAALCTPLVISASIMRSDYFWLLGVTVGLFVLSLKFKSFTRGLGLFLLILYSIYLSTLI